MANIFSHTDQPLEIATFCYFVVQGHLEYFTSFTSEVYSLLKLISETVLFSLHLQMTG